MRPLVTLVTAVPFARTEPDGPGPGSGASEGVVPGGPLLAAVPPADAVAGGIVPESAGEADAVAAGVLSVGDAAGDDDVGNGEEDTEADADGDAGAVPDGLVCGDGDTVGVADDVGTAEGDTEQYAAGRVGDGIGVVNILVPLPAGGEGETRSTAAVLVTAEPAHGAHFCRLTAPGDGEETSPVPVTPWGPCPPGKVPFPFVVPPPPFVPPLLSPVSTVEPTCTMAARNGGTARLRHAMNTMPASMATTGRNWCHDDWRDRASRAAACSRHACSCQAQYPRST